MEMTDEDSPLHTEDPEPIGALPTEEEMDEFIDEMLALPEEELALPAITERPGKSITLLEETSGKKIAVVTDESGENTPAATETGEGNPTKKRKKDDSEENMDYHKMFTDVGFQSPIYPHRDTLSDLGIYTDVNKILSCCNIGWLAETPLPVYPAYAAEFLATVKVFAFPGDAALLNSFGGGFVTFNLKGKPKQIDFKAVETAFGFDRGNPVSHSVSPKDRDRLWREITGEDYQPVGAKATSIRNPAISYARRVIAQTFHGRHDPGNINAADLDFLAISSTTLMDFTERGNIIKGDQAKAGLAFVLCKHLENQRGKISGIIRNGNQPNKLLCGGLITGLLQIVGLPETWKKEQRMEPVFMDYDYLHDNGFLAGPRKGPPFYYRYWHKTGVSKVVQLPNRDITTLKHLRNYLFRPDESLHLDPSALGSTKPRDKTRRFDTQKKKGSAPAIQARAQPQCACASAEYKAKLAADLTRRITKDLERKIRAELQDHFDAKITRELKEMKDIIDRRLPNPPEDSDHTPLARRKETLAAATPPDRRRPHRSLEPVTQKRPRPSSSSPLRRT